MSSKRRSDMDSIQQALDAGTTVSEQSDTPGSTGPAADLTNSLTPSPSTENETPEQQNLGKLTEKDEKAQIQLAKDQDLLVKRQLQTTANSVGHVIGSVRNGIGNVAIPGGLGLPLAVLLVLWAILVKVNGNTRFQWLWLVMTGNAELQGDVSGGSGGIIQDPDGDTGSGGSGGIIQDGTMYSSAGYVPYESPLEMDEW